MEHLVRLAYSDSFLLTTGCVFFFAMLLWFIWARFFPEKDAIKKISGFVVVFGLVMLFFCGYASIAANGLDGVVCWSGRYSSHVVCTRHEENPLLFWGLVVWLMSLFALPLLFALVFLVRMVVPGEQRAMVGARNLRPSVSLDEKRPSTGGMGQGTGRVIVVSAGAIVISTLAWIATVLHQVNDVQEQVAEALASADPEKAAVEAYLQSHGVLPEDNGAMGLSSPADLHKQYVSEVKIAKGSILLRFDATTANERLGGRFVMLIAVRHGRLVSWHCASPDIDDKYLPGRCRIGS